MRGKRALVCGGSAGIGRAIAAAFASLGADVAIVARRNALVMETSRAIGATAIIADLADETQATRAGETAVATLGGLDVLIFAAGHFAGGPIADEPTTTFRALADVSLHGPTALLQAVLPALIASRGDVVFINSTVTRASQLAGRTQYAMAHQALKALADGLRDEVNRKGVRVTSIYPGTTATPRQEAMHAAAGKIYRPERLLQPQDVAQAVTALVALPETAEAMDLYIRPRFFD